MVAHQRLHPGIETGFQYLQFRKKMFIELNMTKEHQRDPEKKHIDCQQR
jgi:hypothetical protein